MSWFHYSQVGDFTMLKFTQKLVKILSCGGLVIWVSDHLPLRFAAGSRVVLRHCRRTMVRRPGGSEDFRRKLFAERRVEEREAEALEWRHDAIGKCSRNDVNGRILEIERDGVAEGGRRNCKANEPKLRTPGSPNLFFETGVGD
jgi:hypothetical protein